MTMKRLTLFILMGITLGNARAQSTDTISVMAYNLLKFPFENAGRIALLKNIVQHELPDVLMVCELTSSSGANAVLSDALNQNGITYYEKSNYVPGTDTENMLYFNTNKLEMYEQNIISTDLRDINEYVLYYKSSDLGTTSDTTFFYMYMCHLKAGQSDSTLRNDMALDLKNYMATRPNIENVVLGGDFNLYTSSEPAWNTVLNGAGVELKDPINTPGAWHNDWGYADVHTQSTRTVSLDNGATGGMDDRFDFIFISPDLLNWGAQAKYIDGTYWAYGQDGNHFNSALTDAPVNTTLPSNIIQDLHDMSDHLPVYMEIEVQTSFNKIDEKTIEPTAYYNDKDQIIILEDFPNGVDDFKVYDLTGKIVLDFSNVSLNGVIHVEDLKKGAYILNSKAYDFSFKFIK